MTSWLHFSETQILGMLAARDTVGHASGPWSCSLILMPMIHLDLSSQLWLVAGLVLQWSEPHLEPLNTSRLIQGKCGLWMDEPEHAAPNGVRKTFNFSTSTQSNCKKSLGFEKWSVWETSGMGTCQFVFFRQNHLKTHSITEPGKVSCCNMIKICLVFKRMPEGRFWVGRHNSTERWGFCNYPAWLYWLSKMYPHMTMLLMVEEVLDFPTVCQTLPLYVINLWVVLHLLSMCYTSHVSAILCF